jgi:quercetin dioxygenase-like cupin family protein
VADPVFLGPGEGGRLGHQLGGEVALKVRGEHSDGRMFAFETDVAPGEGPPLHRHTNEDETLYVIEGEVRFSLDGELETGGAGSLLFVPRGTPHTFQAVGDRQARILIHFAPAGMERFFDRFTALEAPGPEDFARIGAEAGMEVVGPPLAQAGRA